MSRFEDRDQEEILPNKDNTSKLASLWEGKIHGNDEKGVRKSQAVDTPDEIIIKSSKDGSPTAVSVLKSSKQSPRVNFERLVGSAVKSSSSSQTTKKVVDVFEKRANESNHDRLRVSAIATLGTGLRPMMPDVSHRPSDVLSHRSSSVVEAVDNQVDELSRKVESMTMRVSELERQLSILEKRFSSSPFK